MDISMHGGKRYAWMLLWKLTPPILIWRLTMATKNIKGKNAQCKKGKKKSF